MFNRCLTSKKLVGSSNIYTSAVDSNTPAQTIRYNSPPDNEIILEFNILLISSVFITFRYQ